MRFRVDAMVADNEWAAIGFSDDTAMVSVWALHLHNLAMDGTH